MCRADQPSSAPRLNTARSYDGAMTIGYRHVGVIGAMAEEVERLHHHLDAEIVTEHAGRTYRHGVLAGQRVTVVQSRIGKVAAALTASSLIRDHDVDAIVFTGIAGALHDDLAIGDVVVATELCSTTWPDRPTCSPVARSRCWAWRSWRPTRA